jgi:hypothetical protein
VEKITIIKSKWFRVIFFITLIPIIIYVTSYVFLPYGNHLQAAWEIDSKDSIESFYYSKVGSKIILKIRGISCDAPVLSLGYPFSYKYYNYKKSAISQILGLYDIQQDQMNKEQKEFILPHLYKTIEKCDPNVELEGLSPLMQVIFSKNPNSDFIKQLIQRGADVNQKLIHPTKLKSYTPLYLAETSLLKSSKTEAAKESLIKIIELLKQAGAKSEMIELPAK